MTNIVWTGKSDSWGNAADWGPNGLPTDLDAVTISVPGITVSVGAGINAAAYTLYTQGSQFNINGGNLFTVHNATFNGGFSQSAGTYTVSGQGATFNSSFALTGGTIRALSGKLTLVDGGSLAGTLAGGGTLELSGANGATVYVQQGFNCQLSTILLDNGAKLGFLTNYALAHNLTANNAIVDLFGHSLALNATAVLSGVIGNGVINVNNTLTLGTAASSTTLDNGLIVNVLKSAVQANNLSLGITDSGAKINVGKLGHYAINGNWGITDPSNVGSITNSGVFAKTGGGKLSQIDASLTSTGTLQANIGELRLNGLVNSVGGAVSGAGTLGLQGGQTTFGGKLALSVATVHQEGGVVVLNGPLSYAGAWDISGGVLNLNSHSAVLTLSGHADFDGGRVTSYGGTLDIVGQAEMNNVNIGGPTTINVTGAVDQTGGIYFGTSSNPVINVAANASWTDEGDGNITGQFGNFNNSGLFIDPNGTGNAVVQTNFTSTGTIVSNSTLTLTGGNVLGGTLAGNGLIDLNGNTSSSVLETGLVITVAALGVSSNVSLQANLSDANSFSEFTGGVLDLQGHTFALSGPTSLDLSNVTDGGTLATTGQLTVSTYLVEGGAELLVAGHADQIANLSLSGAAGDGTLAIASGAIYSVLDDNYNVISGGTISLAGTLAENDLSNPLILSDVIETASGNILANAPLLSLLGGGSLQGTLSGPGHITLGAGTFTLGSGLALQSGGLAFGGSATVALAANQTYAGDFTASGTLALGSSTFASSGPATLGEPQALTLLGNGTLSVAGATALGGVNVEGNATLTIAGQALQSNLIQVGDPQGGASNATLLIAHGASDTFLAQSSITGDGILSVAGSLLANGNQTSLINTSIVDTGTIAANLGHLQIGGTVSAGSTGSFAIAGGGMIEFLNTSAVGSATQLNFAGAGTLRIDELKGFNATIENFGSPDAIQLSLLNASSLSGTYGSSHNQIVVSDGQNALTLNFSTAQTLSSFTFGAGSGGIATITHT